MWKRYSLTIFSFSFFLLILVSIFNFSCDSNGIFKQTNSVNMAAEAIANGNMVAGLKNYDERLFQQKVFKNFKVLPKCIAIGSSRTMRIESSMIKCDGKFFNHSVSGASLEDYIAIIGMYDKVNKIPKKIILGLDPWIFNTNNGQNRWKTLNPEYLHMLSKIKNFKTNEIKINSQNKYLQLINLQNTQSNLINFLHRKEQPIKIVTSENIDAFIKRGDGSINYPYKTRFQNDLETQKEAKSYLSGQIYSVENFKILSNQQLFENLIQYLLNNDIEIGMSPIN